MCRRQGNPIGRLSREETKETLSIDPIELYAALGLAINHQYQGVFLDYTLGFLSLSPQKVQESIRTSFERGLYRSTSQFGVRQSTKTVPCPYGNRSQYLSHPMHSMSRALPHRSREAFAIFGGTTDLLLDCGDDQNKNPSRIMKPFSTSLPLVCSISAVRSFCKNSLILYISSTFKHALKTIFRSCYHTNKRVSTERNILSMKF